MRRFGFKKNSLDAFFVDALQTVFTLRDKFITTRFTQIAQVYTCFQIGWPIHSRPSLRHVRYLLTCRSFWTLRLYWCTIAWISDRNFLFSWIALIKTWVGHPPFSRVYCKKTRSQIPFCSATAVLAIRSTVVSRFTLHTSKALFRRNPLTRESTSIITAVVFWWTFCAQSLYKSTIADALS